MLSLLPSRVLGLPFGLMSSCPDEQAVQCKMQIQKRTLLFLIECVLESSVHLPRCPHNVVFVVGCMWTERWAEPRYSSGHGAFRPKTNGQHPSYFTLRPCANIVAWYHANAGNLCADRRRDSLSGDGLGFRGKERVSRTPARTRKHP